MCHKIWLNWVVTVRGYLKSSSVGCRPCIISYAICCETSLCAALDKTSHLSACNLRLTCNQVLSLACDWERRRERGCVVGCLETSSSGEVYIKSRSLSIVSEAKMAVSHLLCWERQQACTISLHADLLIEQFIWIKEREKHILGPLLKLLLLRNILTLRHKCISWWTDWSDLHNYAQRVLQYSPWEEMNMENVRSQQMIR